MASGRGPDSDTDLKQHQPVRKGGEGETSSYVTANPFLSPEAATRGVAQGGGAIDQRQPLQKQKVPRDWDLKTSSQNLFIAAAATSGGGILNGKIGGSPAAISTTTGPSVGSYLLGGPSVLQSLFGAQTGSSTVNGTPRLVNGHSALGTFSSPGLAGGAAGGEYHLPLADYGRHRVWDHSVALEWCR